MEVELIGLRDDNKQIIVNNKNVGHFIKDVEGYYYYQPNPKLKGIWDSKILSLLAFELDEVNLKSNSQFF
mgnify:CR=1 FL=1